MAKFLLLNGRHVGRHGEIYQYKDGEPTLVEDHEPLDKHFAGKFKEIKAQADDEPDDEEEGPTELEKGPDVYLGGKKIDTDMKPVGEDVTERFPAAALADLKVFRRGRHYDVVPARGAGEPVASDMTRKKLDEFLEGYSGG